MDWDKLRVFYAVSQAGSFTKAGDNLNLSQSAVSRQISALEDSLHISLFHRHARGLILTEQGDILYQTVKDIFTKLAIAENAITESKERPKGPLRVTASVTLGTLWLTPLLSEFIETYPDIAITLVVDDREMDLSMREADVAIRLFTPKQPDLIYRHLMTIHNSIYASQDYLRTMGVPNRVDELDQHRLITYGEEMRAPFANVNWLMQEGAKPSMQRRSALKINSLFAMLKAVESGLGIASLPDYMVADSPKVTKILDGTRGPKIEAFFVYPSELRNSKRLKVFRDFILRKVAESSF